MTTSSALPNTAPVFAAIDSFIDEAIALRHDFHQHPELSFNEHQTSAKVAAQLRDWGYEVTTDVGGNGVVGVLKKGDGLKTLGIRADIDALPIHEDSGLEFHSHAPGVMHACGHDGHTAILLTAARYLAEHGQFSGTLNLIFQPAEEVGAGARKMIAEGLFDRFPCDAIYGLHNWPGQPAGKFGFVEGPAMASVDWAGIRFVGKGGHGAAPHETVDPIVTTAHFITALQSLVSRNVNPLDSAVITVGSIHGGEAANVIPDSVDIKLTVRTFRPEVRATLRQRIETLAQGVAQSFGATVEIEYKQGHPSVHNHVAETRAIRQVALDLFGPEGVIPDFAPRTASEDFAYFLDERPGSFIFVGTGDGEPLHSPRYRFNDDVIAPAGALWARLAETWLS
jgi:hippurate hydrolase